MLARRHSLIRALISGRAFVELLPVVRWFLTLVVLGVFLGDLVWADDPCEPTTDPPSPCFHWDTDICDWVPDEPATERPGDCY